MGVAMIACKNQLWIAILLTGICAASDPQPKAGIIASDAGGAVGYQHGLKQSRFVTGKESQTVNEAGWSKQVGPEGAFATSLHNGVALALPNAHAQLGRKSEYAMDPDKHNDEVLKYFVTAGIPRDQIAGVHAMTLLSSTGRRGEARASTPKIDGYISVLERKIGDYKVPDSVAWAQMDKGGNVISEGIYWPAIPASALRDAKHIKDMLATKADKIKFLVHVPAELAPGEVVIRHSSAAMQQGPFEVLASYDVMERRTSPESAATASARGVREGSVIMRHFDSDGVERRLPQERRNAEKDYPSPKKTRPAATHVQQKDAPVDSAPQQP